MASFRPTLGSRINNQGGASGRSLRADFNAQMAALLANFRAFRLSVEAEAVDAMVDAIEPVMDQALVYAPIQSGELRASAYIEKTQIRGRPTVAFGFGQGGRPDYAIFVHEMPYEHIAPTRSKFLSAAVEEDISGIQRRFAEGMRRRVKT